MKILKRIGMVILVLVLLIVIVSAFLPGTVVYSRSRVMPISKETAFEKVVVLQQWPKWMTWAKLDTNAVYTYSNEPATGKDAWYTWKGNKDMGEGKMTITDIYGTDSLHMDVKFADYPPNPVVFRFFDKGASSTEVFWSMKMEFPFMMRIMGLFMEGMMAKDFEGGLEGIEKLGLSEPAKKKEGVAEYTIEDSKPMMCLVVADSSVYGKEVSKKIGEDYMLIGKELKEQKAEMGGAPFCVIHRMDEAKNFLVFSPGIPVKAEIKNIKDKKVKYMNLPAQKSLVYNYYGDYMKMQPAYKAMKQYMADNNLESAGPGWEEYLNDPMVEKDTAKWLTRIYMPIK